MHPRATIDRYLAEGLPPRDEARLRDHLRTCSECRDYYDQQVLLYRALAGNPDSSTAAEKERTLRRAVQGAGLALPARTAETRAGLLDRILWAPIPALGMAAALAVLIILGSLWFSQTPTEERPSEPVVAAHVKEGRGLRLGETPVDPRATAEIPIYAGRKIDVDSDGIAEISLERGGSVRVFPGTVLMFFGRGDGLLLLRGKVWCVVRSGGGPFLVRTDVAEVSVLGTSFLVEERQSGVTNVRVVQGTVEVRNVSQKGAVKVQGGRQTTVKADNPPEAPHHYDPVPDVNEWKRFFRDVSAGIKRAVRELRHLFDRL